MMQNRQACECINCGNEAEMTVRCDFETGKVTSGAIREKQRETLLCTICGNEADMIVEPGE